MNDFIGFNKIARLSRNIYITEKIDGTNGQIWIKENGEMIVGSRTMYLGEHHDNHGFYKWVMANRDELMKLGVGRHFGEWWGKGINRGYGIKDKRFSLFNVLRWKDENVRPNCCSIVPVLYEGIFSEQAINECLQDLEKHGSKATPFMDPEGIIIYHTHAGIMFKKTIENDEKPKGIK